MLRYYVITLTLLSTVPILAGAPGDCEQTELRNDIICALEQHQIVYQDLYARYNEQKERVDELGWDPANHEKIALLIELGMQKTAFENLLELKIGDTALGIFDLLHGNPQKEVMTLLPHSIQGIYHALAASNTQPKVTLTPPQDVPNRFKRTRKDAGLPYDENENFSDGLPTTEEEIEEEEYFSDEI